MNETAALLHTLMAFVWVPMLVLAGVLDWACHRRLRIEETAGLPESLLHLLMLGLLGTALLGGVFLQPTAGLLAAATVLLLLHEASYAADLRVALARRRIPAFEQWVHGFQHLLPWAGLTGLLALAPGQALALVGLGGEVADWALRLKQPLPSPLYTGALVAAALLFNVLPFLSEARRSARAAAREAQRSGR